MAHVLKRDGRIEQFDHEKIKSAILRAYHATNKQPVIDEKSLEDIKLKATKIAESAEDIASKNDISVEDIQNYVEKSLMASKHKDVAKSYILYRDARSRERAKKEKLFKEVNEKLAAKNIENQNANVDEHSFGGRKGEAANAIMKQYALDYYMSDMAKNNHLNNEVYIHKLNCA